ncbi:cadmium-translocating P-type ATPase [Lutibacter sp. B2]|nr:cadmium-translocating P-type ATPase [Lutibacter sp. B2]
MNESSKIELILDGLHCANCANKIEKKVNTLESVNEATFNFVTKKLGVKIKNNAKANEIIDEVKMIVKKLEPHVAVIEAKKSITHSEHNHSHNNGQCCDHDHGHSHEHSHGEGNNKRALIRLGIGAVIFAIAVALKFPHKVEFALYAISYLLVGGEVLLIAFKNILRGQIFDENFLMTIATIGAFSIGEFPEGVAVMLFYQAGEFMQGLAVNRSRKSIASLMDIRPDFANLKIGNDIKKVSPEEVDIGDLIIVKPGEKIPLDGKVIDGKSMMDTSALTGESVLRDVEVEDEVLGGFINKNGVLTIEVTKTFEESTIAKILDMVENASSKKAPIENFITKFARYYTPAVVFSALAVAFIPPLTMEGATFSAWIYKALIFLVISCPCALVVSIPLGFFGGIGGASKNGILVKGGNFLEGLNNVGTIVFDKTGTLTKGVFKVNKIYTENFISEEEVLEYAAFAESYSNHPIAISILKEYKKEVNKDELEDYEELSGYGVRVKVKGKEVLAGNTKLMEQENIEYRKIDDVGTIIYVAIDKKFAGAILIADEIKEDAKEAIKGLKAIGIKKIVMLTGDNISAAGKVARELSIDEVYSELLPDQKVEKLEMINDQKDKNEKVIFVGDGINDAPVIARADIGIAMGALGSDAAIEAADVVLMTDEPSKIVSAIKIAKMTKKIVWQNIIFALGTKGIVLALGVMGHATMWEAVFADVGVALIAILNSMRAMKVQIK